MKMIPLSRSFSRALSLSALSVALIATLGACSSLGLGDEDTAAQARALDLACPRVETPAPLAMITQNGAGDGPGMPNDLGVTASLRITSTDCDVDKDEVKLKVAVQLTASRGAALQGDEAKLAFFAATLDGTGELLNKKLYQTTFDFDGEISDTEKLTIDFTFNRTQAGAGRVIIGYQLSRDAWEAVRAEGAR